MNSLKAKLFFSAILASVIALGLVGIAAYSLQREQFVIHRLVDQQMPKLDLIARLRVNNHTVMRSVLFAALSAGKDREEALKKSDERSDEFKGDLQNLLKIEMTDALRDSLKVIEKDWAAFDIERAKVLAALRESKDEGDERAKKLILSEIRVRSNALVEHLKEASGHVDNRTNELASEAQALSSRLLLSMIVIGCLGALINLTYGFFLALRLSRVLNRISKSLAEDSSKLKNASLEISEASTRLSESATEQAAALQQTVSSVDQVSAMVGKNSENAGKSAKIATESSEIARRGKESVEQVIGSMSEIEQSNGQIANQIEESNRQLGEIVKVISDIGSKTKVINDIVFQTKLLSFNASVEAARAGEHGKGFAVVAEEVGNLAQMSGNAAKEISAMLEGSISKVEQMVRDTRARVEQLVAMSKDKVSSGHSTAIRCGEVLEELVKNVTQVSEMASEIARASEEQAQGVQEINKAMSQLDQVTQQNATAAQESSKSSSELRGQASSLAEVAGELLETVQGHKNGGASSSDRAARDGIHAESEPSHAYAFQGEKKSGVAKNGSDSRVIPFPSRHPQEFASHSRLKTASGDDIIPSAEDPRFEDV